MSLVRQIQLTECCFLLHNHIRNDALFLPDDDEEVEDYHHYEPANDDDYDAANFRDDIAPKMWNDYVTFHM